MKVALVCDWLTEGFGGAERVLLAFHRLYPDAPIYTSKATKQGIAIFRRDSKNRHSTLDIRTGWLQIFPTSFRRILGPLRQLYFSHLDLSSYDLVISVTGAEAKAVRTKNPKNRTNSSKTEHSEHHCFHLCYCHVPTQYYWQKYDEYLENPGFGVLNPLVRLALKLFIRPLRRVDQRSAKSPDLILTPSNYARELVEKYYKREALVVAPPVNLKDFSTSSAKFSTTSKNKSKKSQAENRAYYNFINISRQVSWKRLDLAILACLRTGHHLTLIGDGPEHKKLYHLAHNSPLITFKTAENPENIKKLYHQMNNSDTNRYDAFLFPSLEPFGIAPVEALSSGLPVIAYGKGGALDYIKPGKNGLLFPDQTVDSLTNAINSFEPASFRLKTVSTSVKSFDTSVFERKIKELVRENLR